MSGFMSNVDARTGLAGSNRLEMLLFHLGGHQQFGINVFKVREVIPAVELSEMPGANPHVKGIAHLRGTSVPVIDLSEAMGGQAQNAGDTLFIIVTEYNRNVQGFLVSGVDRIININWNDVSPPPNGVGRNHYLTAVTKVQDRLVQIIDVEKIFSEISGEEHHVSEERIAEFKASTQQSVSILAVDDSLVARKQILNALKEVGIHCHLANDGDAALQWLKEFAEKYEGPIQEHLPVVLSDIEMPNMDGYTLTAEIKADPALNKLSVILHSSLSGVFNEAMVKRVGADKFIAKFHPDELVDAVQSEILRINKK